MSNEAVIQSGQTHVPATHRVRRPLNCIKAGDLFRERQPRIWNSRSSGLLATSPSNCPDEVLQGMIEPNAIELYNYSSFYSAEVSVQ